MKFAIEVIEDSEAQIGAILSQDHAEQEGCAGKGKGNGKGKGTGKIEEPTLEKPKPIAFPPALLAAFLALTALADRMNADEGNEDTKPEDQGEDEGGQPQPCQYDSGKVLRLVRRALASAEGYALLDALAEAAEEASAFAGAPPIPSSPRAPDQQEDGSSGTGSSSSSGNGAAEAPAHAAVLFPAFLLAAQKRMVRIEPLARIVLGSLANGDSMVPPPVLFLTLANVMGDSRDNSSPGCPMPMPMMQMFSMLGPMMGMAVGPCVPRFPPRGARARSCPRPVDPRQHQTD